MLNKLSSVSITEAWYQGRGSRGHGTIICSNCYLFYIIYFPVINSSVRKWQPWIWRLLHPSTIVCCGQNEATLQTIILPACPAWPNVQPNRNITWHLCHKTDATDATIDKNHILVKFYLFQESSEWGPFFIPLNTFSWFLPTLMTDLSSNEFNKVNMFWNKQLTYFTL